MLAEYRRCEYETLLSLNGVAMAQAYCVKCKATREISNPAQVQLKNGRPATQGTCSVCGTKVFRIGKT